MSLIPPQYELVFKAVVGLAVVVALFVAGDHYGVGVEHARRVAEVDTLKAEYQARVDAATNALEVANEHSRQVEQAAQASLAANDVVHQKEITDEQAKTAAAVSAYRDGQLKLRFYADAASHPASSGAVPGASAAASSGDGRTIVDVPAALAESLLSLTGEVDDQLVPQIHLLQDTVRSYVTACGPQRAAQ